MKGDISITQFNSLLNSIGKLDTPKDESGKELPKDRLWIVADPKLVKKHGKLVSETMGIEFRKATLGRRKVIMAGL